MSARIESCKDAVGHYGVAWVVATRSSTRGIATTSDQFVVASDFVVFRCHFLSRFDGDNSELWHPRWPKKDLRKGLVEVDMIRDSTVRKRGLADFHLSLRGLRSHERRSPFPWQIELRVLGQFVPSILRL